MFIERLIIRNYKAIKSFEMYCPDGESVCMVGLNGCGKTTALNVIAGLTGVPSAFDLINDDASLEYCELVVNDYGVRKVFRQKGAFDLNSVLEFKATLSQRTSYVLLENLDDDRYVGVKQEMESAITYMGEWLNRFQLGFDVYHYGKNCSTILMSETGAQRNMVTAALRLPPPNTVPILADAPDRSLHIVLRRSILDTWRRGEEQIIVTTHCPETLTGFSYGTKAVVMSFDHGYAKIAKKDMRGEYP